MAYTVLLTSTLPLGKNSLSELERLIRSFEVDTRPISFADSLTCHIDNLLAVVIATAQGPALSMCSFGTPASGASCMPQIATRACTTLCSRVVSIFFLALFTGRIRRPDEAVEGTRRWIQART